MAMVTERFGVYLVRLDPIVGSEIGKTRPCLVVSPDEMNRNIRTAIVAPMTTARKSYPTRIICKIGAKEGEIVLDQLRTVDRSRVLNSLGKINAATAAAVTRA